MNLDDFQSIRILVISDMHVTKEDSGQSNSYLTTGLMELPVKDNPIEALKEYLAQYPLEIDYVVNLGDVTDRAYKEGWISGIKMLRDVQKSKNIPTLLHVLGNHDLSLGLDNHQEFYLPQHTRDFPVANKDLTEQYWSKGYCIYINKGALFLLCNTEQKIKSVEDLTYPPVFLDDFNAELDEDLSQFDEQKLIRIVLMHHHIVPHADIVNTLNKEDVIVNGDKFIDVLKRHKFNLVLHGHKHVSRLKEVDGITIFASGSLAGRQNLLHWNGNNYFHLITLDTDGNEVNGYVESVMYIPGKGWSSNSDMHDVVFPHNGFGYKKTISEIKEKIINSYKETLEEHKMVAFETIADDFHEFMYLTHDEMETLKEEMEELGYMVVVKGKDNKEFFIKSV